MSMILHLISLVLAFAAPQTPAPATRVIVSSVDWTITIADLEQIVKTFPLQERERFANGDNVGTLVDELVRIWALTSDARKRGIDIGADYESRKKYYQQYAREVAAAIREENVRSYYESHLNDFTQVGFSHILIL